MTAILKGAGAVVSFSGKTYSFGRGEIPADTPAEVVEILRQRGALASHAATPAPATVAPAAPEPAAGGTPVFAPAPGLPADAPDPSSASAGEIAAYIDSHDLNATQTVALAGGTAAGAARVLEAEQIAHGGDARTTVIRALQRLIDGGETG